MSIQNPSALLQLLQMPYGPRQDEALTYKVHYEAANTSYERMLQAADAEQTTHK